MMMGGAAGRGCVVPLAGNTVIQLGPPDKVDVVTFQLIGLLPVFTIETFWGGVPEPAVAPNTSPV